MDTPLEQVRDRSGRVWVHGWQNWQSGDRRIIVKDRTELEARYGPLADMRGEGWTSHGHWVGASPEPPEGFPERGRCGGPAACPQCISEKKTILAP
jgi:hypothetical protein